MACCALRRRGQHLGFTLIELVVALAVLGILLSVAVPAMRDFMYSQAVDAHANELATSLRMARSEALKRGYEVSVCAGANGVCSGTANWDKGWVVFVDNAGGAANGTLVATEKVLRVQDGVSGIGEVSASAQSVTLSRSGILLASDGAAVAAGSTVSIVLKVASGGDAKARTICLNKQGRVSVGKGVLTCA